MVLDFYEHDRHLGNVTKSILINSGPLFPKRLPIKCGFNWQNSSRVDV